jgi:hypothetical protein
VPAAKTAAPAQASAAPVANPPAAVKLRDGYAASGDLHFKGGSPALDLARAKDAPPPDASALARQKVAENVEAQAFAGLLGVGKRQPPKTPADPSFKTPASGSVKTVPQQAKVATQLALALGSQVAQLAQSSPRQLGKAFAQIYGDKTDSGQISRLVQQAAAGKLPLPANVRFVDGATLQGNNAAYLPENGGTVLLDRRLLEDPKALAAAFTEEAGHHLDTVLGSKDSKGDEGQLFLQAIQGGRMC